jgi:hypothetical protein
VPPTTSPLPRGTGHIVVLARTHPSSNESTSRSLCAEDLAPQRRTDTSSFYHSLSNIASRYQPHLFQQRVHSSPRTNSSTQRHLRCRQWPPVTVRSQCGARGDAAAGRSGSYWLEQITRDACEYYAGKGESPAGGSAHSPTAPASKVRRRRRRSAGSSPARTRSLVNRSPRHRQSRRRLAALMVELENLE